MTPELELIDFTNWLYDNNWNLNGDGTCINNKTNKVSNIGELAELSKTIQIIPCAFRIGDTVKDTESGDLVEITNITFDKYKKEYQYWYEDEDGDEWYGFEDNFEKV